MDNFHFRNLNTWRLGFASFQVKGTIYISVPFTWLFHDVVAFIRKKGTNKKVVIGGPGAILLKREYEKEGFAVTSTIDWFEPVTIFNPFATFTTRGCVNSCSFCAVPKIEGEFREITNYTPRPVICDNNFLASSRKHFDRVVDSLKPFPFVDFSQGVEARLFTPRIADRLSELKNVNLRFAFDSVNKEKEVTQAVKLAIKKGFKNVATLMLFGFTDTPSDALYRAELLRKLGSNVYPMRYMPLLIKKRVRHVSKEKGWTEYELQRFKKYWTAARNGILDDVPFSEFEIGQTLKTKHRKGFGVMDHIAHRETSGIYK